MEIHLNGESRQIDGTATIAELLERFGYASGRIAVEVNQTIVPRSMHASHRLAEGDRIEVVTAFGGG